MTDPVTSVVQVVRPVSSVSTAIQGPPGPAGPAGAVVVSVEFTPTTSGTQTVVTPSSIGSWHALYVNGLRQYPSNYSVATDVLTIPSGVTWIGADCLFEYFPAETG